MAVGDHVLDQLVDLGSYPCEKNEAQRKKWQSLGDSVVKSIGEMKGLYAVGVSYT